jgi:tRNA(Ile)-lysidine synthase
MLHILGKIPNIPFAIACSGGIDSMVLVDFCKRYPANKFKLAYFDHETKTSEQQIEFLSNIFGKRHLLIGHLTASKTKNQSQEEYWRDQRYNFFLNIGTPLLTAHHLDDAIETWIMTSLHGKSRLIPYSRNNVIRPFLLIPKKQITSWAARNDVKYSVDLSNFDTRFDRNYVRHVMMPNVLRINPGIHKTIKKLILSEYKTKMINNGLQE